MKKIIIGMLLVFTTLQLTGCGGGGDKTNPAETLNESDTKYDNLPNNTFGTFDNNGSISVYNTTAQNLNKTTANKDEKRLVIDWRRSGKILLAKQTILALRDANTTDKNSFAFRLLRTDSNHTIDSYAYGVYDSSLGQRFNPRSTIDENLVFFYLKDNHTTYLVERGTDIDNKITELILGAFTSDGNGNFIFTPKKEVKKP